MRVLKVIDAPWFKIIDGTGHSRDPQPWKHSGLIGREQSLVDQLLAVGDAVIEIDAQCCDGCAANCGPAYKVRRRPTGSDGATCDAED